ncbi:multidrug ABC transporter permease [Pseudofrankia asymbiotica]|uniref:Multidrug ABC transporter permease n=1 Tax=Pseudofrankia asymbiotica TaxID=1834516 RepID=A0A1V2I110_9ACTN|nr:multidrug ABC transporter permease [Pseudofrankia asymbiotica]
MTAFTGARPLLRVALRQNARAIAPWVMLISALSASSILAYAWIFPDASDRAELAHSLGGNPALALIFGPARDLTTPDGFNAWRAGALGAFFAGLMEIFIVIRNSRADEDSGQAELLASGVLGRQARLAVAVLLAAVAAAALGMVSFALTVACGGAALPSLTLSATFTASALVFAGVAAICAQLGSDARTADSLAVAVLGVCYVIRGYLDSSEAPGWTSWTTPLGWLSRTRPATDDNPWPLLAALALTIALVLAGSALHSRRDYGLGLIAPRRGPARGGATANVWGLAFRLHRGTLAAWLVAFASLGLIFGNLATSLGDVLRDNPALAGTLAAGATDPAGLTFAFLITILNLVGIIAAVAGVQVALRIHAEEVDYRVEPLLAGALRRHVYLASNAVVALAAPAVALAVAGTALGLVAAAQKDTIAAGDVATQALVTIPAVWTLVALALAAVGAVPSRRLVAWLGIVATFGLTLLGPTFNLPGWALGISPLRHVPNVTAAAPDWPGLAWLTGVAALFLVVAFTGFRRRDIV